MVWGYNGFRGFMVWGYNGFRVLWFGVIAGSGFYGLGLQRV